VAHPVVRRCQDARRRTGCRKRFQEDVIYRSHIYIVSGLRASPTQPCIALATMDVANILDRAQEAVDLTRNLLQKQHTAETTISCHNLSSALSILSAALTHTLTLLERITAIEAPQNALLNISNVLSHSIPVLRFQMHVLSDETGRDLLDCPHRLLQGMAKHLRRVECGSEICDSINSINSITTNLIQSYDLLDIPNLNARCTSHCHRAEDDRRHQAKAPAPDSSNGQMSTVLPKARQTDQENQDKHVHFAADPPDLIIPLPGSFAKPAELSASRPMRQMPAGERFRTEPHRRYDAQQGFQALNAHSESEGEAADQRHTASENVTSSKTNDEHLPPLDLPSLEPTGPQSPPPPYSPCHKAAQDHDARSPSDHMYDPDTSANPRPTLDLTDLSDEEPDEVWTDPITLGCREIMRQRFPTTTPALYDDYMAYREQVRNSSSYKWYLNFRYLSLTLQPDLPMQVFMVGISSCVRIDGQATTQFEMGSVLAYLFEDLIVFARSPFVSSLPDPNATTSEHVPLVIDSGLEVLEHQSLRFCHIRHATEVDKTALLIECSHNLSEDQTQHRVPFDRHTRELRQKRLVHITFQTTCQRRKVSQPLKPWIEEDQPQHTHNDDQIPHHHHHHNYSHCHRHKHSHSHHCAKKHYPHPYQPSGRHQRDEAPNFHDYRPNIHDAFTPRHHRSPHHEHNSDNMEFSQTSNERRQRCCT